MRRYLSFWMVLLVMVMVHVDWHFGRGHHHRLSLSWPYHWFTGVVTFILLTLFCSKKWPENPIRATLINGAAGLVAGQIIEPLAEVVFYRIPIAIVFSAERWHVFLQFFLAAVAGAVAGLVVVWSCSKTRAAQAMK
jgi:hypothetical protein